MASSESSNLRTEPKACNSEADSTDSRNRPSKNTTDYWLHARNESNMNNRKPTENCGKWLIFAPVDEIDDFWETIKDATISGDLGFASKVSTMKDNEEVAGSSGKVTKVICVYTYDWTDRDDVMRVRDTLRMIGFPYKIPYKADADTHAGKYAHRGNTRISKYYC